MPLKYVQSNRGELLNVGNFLYRKDRGSYEKCSWRCIMKGCKGRIHTYEDQHGEASEHIHAPDAVEIEVREHVARLKNVAVEASSVSNSALVATSVAAIGSAAVKGRMPNLQLLRQRVANARKRAGPSLPPEPRRREDLIIPDFLKVTLSGEQFLYHDSGEGDPNRLVVFTTAANLSLLRDNPEWFVDGTFKTCPLIFDQLYTIHVKLTDGSTIPAVYSLLPGKNRQTYARFLSLIEDAMDGFHPQAVHMDFELAMMKEIESHFPAAGILGCAFHFNQCLWRHIQDEAALRDKYVTDGDFALGTRKFAALSFVPMPDVESAFEALLSSEFVRSNDEILRNFVKYYRRTWIGDGPIPPLFKIEWWNLHALVLSSIGQTNNNVEGWHSAFAGRLGSSHPTVAKLVQQLLIEQGRAEFTVTNSVAQGAHARMRKKYRDRQSRLFTLVSSYSTRNILDFLEAIAHTISF